MPDFSGVWLETQPESGPPVQLQLVQYGSRVQVRISYRDYFSDKISAQATLENGTASWSLRQSCVGQFRWPGYNYDNPGASMVTLSLRHSIDPGVSEPLLVYTQETRWDVPCANNHPIGVERVQKLLKRQ
jgi:hypothetical protein